MTLRTCGLSLWLNFLFPCLNASHQIATGPVPFGECISTEMGLCHQPAVLRSWGIRSSQKWETWARRGFLQPRPAPWGSLHWKREQSLFAALDLLPGAASSCPQYHPFTPDASLTRLPRNMEVWRDSEELFSSPSLMGVSTQVGGSNIVLPSDLQDTASPSQKTSHIDPFPGDSFP